MTIVQNNYMILWMIQNYKSKLKLPRKEEIMSLNIIMMPMAVVVVKRALRNHLEVDD